MAIGIYLRFEYRLGACKVILLNTHVGDEYSEQATYDGGKPELAISRARAARLDQAQQAKSPQLFASSIAILHNLAARTRMGL